MVVVHDSYLIETTLTNKRRFCHKLKTHHTLPVEDVDAEEKFRRVGHRLIRARVVVGKAWQRLGSGGAGIDGGGGMGTSRSVERGGLGVFTV